MKKILSVLALICVISGCNTPKTSTPAAIFSGKIYYVDAKHPTASDNNPGTKGKPWKTLTHAGKTAKAGEKVIIRPGVYHETLKNYNSGQEGKPIIFEGEILGKTIIDGSVAITNWNLMDKSKNIWVAKFPKKLHVPPRKRLHKYRFWSFADLAELMFDDEHLFWRDGLDLQSGSWTSDREKESVYVRLPDDSDPNKKEMTVSGKDYGVYPRKSPSDITYKNLTIRRFHNGMRLYGRRLKVENCVIEWSSKKAAYTNPHIPEISFINNTVRWNGENSLGNGENAVYRGNKIFFSNWRLNAPGWMAAGIKHHYGNNGVFEDNHCAYNACMGIWLDEYPQNCVIKNNLVHDNAANGLEAEISENNLWEGNVCFRNNRAFQIYAASKNTITGNIFSDNLKGMTWTFRRMRKPHEGREDVYQNNYRRWYPEEDVQKWLKTFKKYHSPCSMVRDNIVTGNAFINNGVDFERSTDFKPLGENEDYFVSGNKFSDNFIFNSKPDSVIWRFGSLENYLKKYPTDKNNVYTKFNPSTLPDGLQEIYEKYKKVLVNPRSYKSVAKIYQSLAVENATCQYYHNKPSPAGLLALSRICESDIVKEKKFSDPMLKGFFINYKGENTLVLWRKHGLPTDFCPVLLKNLPKNVKCETSIGKEHAISRKNGLASINVGTWPLYLIACPETIEEQLPFKLTTKLLKEAHKSILTVNLSDAIGDGLLTLDGENSIEGGPTSVNVKSGRAEFKVTLNTKVTSFNRFKLSGRLNGFYCGNFSYLPGTSRNVGYMLRNPNFKAISLAEFENCNFSDEEPGQSFSHQGKDNSLINLPNQLTLKKIRFDLSKRLCVGFAAETLEKNRPERITLKLDGEKYQIFAILLVCAYGPRKKGAPLLEYKINYSDNMSESRLCLNKIHLYDWWEPLDGLGLKFLGQNNSYVIWTGDNGSGRKVNVYLQLLANPNPQKGIDNIEISIADQTKQARIGLLGIQALSK